MPIIPRFTLQQTATNILLDVFVPHIRVTAVEVVVEETEDNGGSIVHVSAAPVYLLVLNLAPYWLVVGDDESNDAAIEPIQGTVHIQLEKLHAGQHWENLDLIGALVQPRTNTSTTRRRIATVKNGINNDPHAIPTKSRWLREVMVGSDSEAQTLSDHQPEEDDSVETDETTRQNQHPPIIETLCNTTANPATTITGYGFARLFHGVFTDLVHDGLAREMLEGHDAVVNTTKRERRRRRIATENSKFCAVRYLGDSMDTIEDDYLYQCAVTMQPQWMPTATEHDKIDAPDSIITADERLQLQSIPYPLLNYPRLNTQQLRGGLMVGLVDLLFAYVYDHLLTQGDPTVESAWTVSILSASLSWLDDWIDDSDADAVNGAQNQPSLQELVQSVVRSSLRRALIYPYLRNYEFAVEIVLRRHVVTLLRSGLRPILRGLLQMRRILNNSELHYLGNKLYVDPYLAWLQKTAAEDLDWNAVADAVEACLQDKNNLKESLHLDLFRIEASLLDDDDSYECLSSGDDKSSTDEENSSEDDEMTIDDSSSSSRSTAEEVDDSIHLEDEDEDRISRDLLDISLRTSDKEAAASNNPMDLFRVVLRQTTTVEEAEEEPSSKNRKILIEELP